MKKQLNVHSRGLIPALSNRSEVSVYLSVDN